MKILIENNKAITITCQCGCDDFYRNESEAKICKTYLEGFFNCSQCDMITDYTDDNFVVVDYQIKLL